MKESQNWGYYGYVKDETHINHYALGGTLPAIQKFCCLIARNCCDQQHKICFVLLRKFLLVCAPCFGDTEG
jgi:hypothetical protein